MSFASLLDQYEWIYRNYPALEKALNEYEYDGLKGKNYNPAGRGSSAGLTSVEMAAYLHLTSRSRDLTLAESRVDETVKLLRIQRKGLGPLLPLQHADAERLAERDGEVCYNPNCSHKASGAEDDRLRENTSDGNRRCHNCFRYWHNHRKERPFDLVMRGIAGT